MMSTSGEGHALNQLQVEQSKLLDKIDELRDLGVSGLVQLPQLIVCGSQSSGKSSVLEAISRVRFPAKDNVCTRFATEVILRRSPQTRVKVSIEPGVSRTKKDEQAKLRTFSSESFSASEDLQKLIKEAEECMGIGSSTHFTDDVLKVEIAGPDKPELTLVDLPGLYNSSSEEQSQEGLIMVRELTKKYMMNPRSIILAIMSANFDYHLQQVLNLAGNIDTKHERTLGIVTHPDRVSPGSDGEDTWIKFIKNDKIKLQLGWHVLQNRKFETRLDSDDKRDELEREFFNQGRWASLSREIVGIDSLRRRLSNILLKHVRHELPGLINDIETKIVDHEHKLAKMGTARSSVKDQRGFLVDISSKFGRITDQALNGMYSDKFFGGFDDREANNEDPRDFRKLRAVIREMNENFAEAISIRGCRRIILSNGSNVGHIGLGSQFNLPYMDGWVPTYVHEHDLQEEMESQAVKNRGLELPGNANQLLVGSLFRDQSEPWEKLAERHLTDVWASVNYFVGLVLQYLTDEHTYSSLMRDLIIPEMDILKASLFDKLTELTFYRKSGHPLPLGKAFLSKIHESRQKRQLAVLKKELGLATSPSIQDDLEKTFRAKDLDRAATQLQSSSDRFAAAEIIDQMQAYYDTAIITFIDNIAVLAVENCLLQPLEQIFTGQTIIQMDDDQIHSIAAEPINVELDRTRLNEELRKLKTGRQTLSVFSSDGPSLLYRPAFASKPAPLSKTSTRSAKVVVTERAYDFKEDKKHKDQATKSLFESSVPTPGPSLFSSSLPPTSTKPSSFSYEGISSVDKPWTPFSGKGSSASPQPTPNNGLFSVPVGPFGNAGSSSSTFGLNSSTAPFSSLSIPKPGLAGPTVGNPASSSSGIGLGSKPAPTGPAFGAPPIQGGSLFGTPNISSPSEKPRTFFSERDTNTGLINYYQTICLDERYKRYSPEELRLMHYKHIGST